MTSRSSQILLNETQRTLSEEKHFLNKYDYEPQPFSPLEELKKSKSFSQLLQRISFNNNIELTHQQEKHFDLNSLCLTNKFYSIMSCFSCNGNNFYKLPCNSFFCEKCRKKISMRIKRNAQKYLWDCNHFMIVFTLPTEIRKFVTSWKDYHLVKVRKRKGQSISTFKRSVDLIYKSVSDTIKEYEKKYKLQSGSILLPHTYGTEKLNWNFHINVLISSKAFDLSNEQNKIINYQINFNEIRRIYKKHLDKNFSIISKQTPQVKFAERNKSIYISYKKSIGVLLDYFRHIPIGMRNVKNITTKNICYQTPKSREKNKSFSVTHTDFFNLITQHIPPSKFRSVRAYGLYSNKNKKRLKYPVKLLKSPKKTKCSCCDCQLGDSAVTFTVSSGFIVYINPNYIINGDLEKGNIKLASILDCYDFDLDNVMEIEKSGRVRGSLLPTKQLKPPEDLDYHVGVYKPIVNTVKKVNKIILPLEYPKEIIEKVDHRLTPNWDQLGKLALIKFRETEKC